MVYIALGAEIYRLHHLFDQFDVTVVVAITILIWLLLQKFHSRKKNRTKYKSVDNL